MIQVKRGIRPDYFNTELFSLANEKMEEFYLSSNRTQKRYNFPFNSDLDNPLKSILHDRFHGKCGYCETKIEDPQIGIIDRFRPHNGVRDKKEYFEDLYWWLVFEWDNLIYSCKECSQYKANYFPIKGKRALSRDSSLKEEKALLLDPCIDNVESHFIHKDAKLDSNSDKGLQTIELLNLNRTSLVANRRKALFEIKSIIDRITENIDNASTTELKYLNQIFDKEPSIEFALVKYEFLIEELDEKPYLRKYIINDDDPYSDEIDEKIQYKRVKRNNKKFTTSDFFPIEYIKITNFKNIVNIRIDFPVDQIEQHACITLLGENGLGKSSILQAICLGLSPNLNSANINDLIRIGESEATITIKQRDSENILSTKLTRGSTEIEHTGNFFSPLIGYGSVRLLPNKKLKPEASKKQIRYQNLFDSSIAIGDILPWISSIYNGNRSLFDSIAYSLKKLLPEKIDENLVIVDGDLIFETSGKSFSSLSDGYKNTISLALDIMKTLSEENVDMEKLSGIVLIDELGNQLHPRWQMQVVSQLRSVFPKVNFIISTHHPLCLRGMKENEVFVLDKDEQNQTFMVKNIPNPSLMRVDQILTSPMFGLHSAVDPETENTFNEYYALLAKDDLSDEEENRKNELGDKIPKMKFLGDSLREELAIYVIDELLAKKKNSIDIDQLKQAAKDRVKSIWDSLDKDFNSNDIR